MNTFKLELLTPVVEKDTQYFLRSMLTDTNQPLKADQKSIQSFDILHETYNFSFDEKIAFHKNAQKDLSFSMNQRLFYQDQGLLNPYTQNIHIGSQLLLTDRFQHEYLFTVESIKTVIHELNITYQYQCRDSFTVQTSNQNQGYTITNDIEDANFIGAQNIDYGAHKILEECHNAYHLINIREGLALQKSTTSGDVIPLLYQLYNPTQSYQKYPVNLTDITQIVKEPLDTDQTKYHIFKEEFLYSCNNSNCLAALIDLATQRGCVIETYEKLGQENEKGKLRRYVGLTPAKNDHISGLAYKPTKDLQNFSFALKGNNIASILNIAPVQKDKEGVTLIPTVPAIFKNGFLSTDGDINNAAYLKYTPNMFTRFIQQHQYHAMIENVCSSYSDNHNHNIYGYKLNGEDNPEIQNFGKKLVTYPNINFDSTIISNEQGSITNKQRHFYLFLPYKDQIDQSTEGLGFHIIPDHTTIPAEGLNESYPVIVTHAAHEPTYWYPIIGILLDDKEKVDQGADIDLSGQISRDNSPEELEFASIADKCPGLENKIIDFSYALKQHLISPAEYRDLNDYFQNDLRLLNGRLLTYYQSYLQALHNEQQALNYNTTQIDRLQATTHSALQKFAQEGKITLQDGTNFNKLYRSVFYDSHEEYSTVEDNKLYNFDSLLTQYYNNGFNADQKFFRHVKSFRDYFLGPNAFTTNATQDIWEHTITAESKNKEKYFSFQPTSYQSIYSDGKLNAQLGSKTNEPLVDIYYLENNVYHLLPIPTNYSLAHPLSDDGKFVKPDTTPVLLPAQGLWDKQQQYYIKETEGQTIFSDQGPGQRPQIIQKEIKYVQLTKQDIIQLYLSKHQSKYYLRRTQDYIPFDWIRYPITDGTTEESNDDPAGGGNFKALANTYYPAMSLPQNAQTDLNLGDDQSTFDTFRQEPSKRMSFTQTYLRTYIQNFPLQSLYYYGPLYDSHNEDSATVWCRVNEVRQTKADGDKQTKDKERYTNPDEFLTMQAVTFQSMLPVGSTDLNNLDIDNYINNALSLQESFNYYAYCPNQALTEHARNLGIAAASMPIGLVASIFLGPLAFIAVGAASAATGIASAILSAQARYEENCQWIQKYQPYRYFTPIIKPQNQSYSFSRPEINDDNVINVGDSGYALYAKSAEAAEESDELIRLSIKQNLLEKPSDKATQTGISHHALYFNYYKFLVASYSFEYTDPLDADGKLKEAYDKDNRPTDKYKGGVKGSTYSRILTKDDYINRNEKYYIIILGDHGTQDSQIANADDGTLFNKFNWPHFNPGMSDTDAPLTFNNLQYYGLPKNLLDVSMISKEEWGDHNTILVNTLKDRAGGEGPYPLQNGTLDIVFSTMLGNQKIAFIIVHDEPYETVTITDQTQHINGDNYTITYQDITLADKIYNIATHNQTDILSQVQMDSLGDIVMLDQETDHGLPVTTADLANTTIPLFVYQEKTKQVIPTYSFEQLNTTEQPYQLYYRTDAVYKGTDLIEQINGDQAVTLYKHTITSNGTEHSHTIQQENNVILTFENGQASYPDKDHPITIFTHKAEKIMTIPKMNNGAFGYYFHTSKESLLREQALVIESQLEEYGQQILSASLYSHYMVPDNGRPSSNGHKNYLAQSIIIVPPSQDSTDTSSQDSTDTPKTYKNLSLSNIFLPDIAICHNENTDNQYNRIQFHYNQNIAESQVKSAELPGLAIKHYQNLIADNVESSLALISANGSIDTNQNVQEVYYYPLSGGTLGSDIWNIIYNKTENFTLFSGGYPTMFNLLATRFTSAPKSPYEDLQKQKDLLWKKLYALYPHVLLERQYENKDALTSAELGASSQLAFKDQMNPETEYNLSIIALDALSNYQGQELHIGDPIQVDAQELYDEYDSITPLLTQFLYISDISYDLRKSHDVKITVNTLKYQEKVLEQLVKLIR